jgi:hypothetical protein
VPTVGLPDDELAAVTAAIRGVIEGDRYPHAPRLDPLRGPCKVRRGVKADEDRAASQGRQAGAAITGDSENRNNRPMVGV